MLEQAADALNRQDYQTAAKLIAELVKQQPDNHHVRLYTARLQEATDKLDDALDSYRLLLQQAIDPKITVEARQGIERIDRVRAEIEAHARVCERAGIEDNQEPGLLVLEPMSLEHKEIVISRFAKIMEIDPYSARLKLPTRGWRLYTLGTMGELEFYADRLTQAEIPNFCVSQQDTQRFFNFKVNYFQSFAPQATIVCTDDRSQLHTFDFNWSEVTQMVMGMLPIFEEVVQIDHRNQTYRSRPKVLDYIHICDLQLHKRRSIFRLCSQTYDFSDLKQSLSQNRRQFTDEFSSELTGDLSSAKGRGIQLTSRDNWKDLMAQVREYVSDVPIMNDFTPFAETALGFPELLTHINPHLELLRRTDSAWDSAFQLYSMLSMCKRYREY